MSIKLGDEPVVLNVGAVRDAAGFMSRPGVIHVRDGVVVDGQARAHEGRVVDFPDLLVMPGMVNAHAHLSMTPVGCQPYGGQFTDWIVSNAGQLQGYFDQGGTVRQAVEQGVAMLADAGVVAVGDVTLRVDPFEAYRVLGESGLAGVSHIEILGPGGPTMAGELERLEQVRVEAVSRGAVRLGLQPHAPYSTVPALYRACVELANARGLAVMTHLAELPQEAQYVRSASGPFRDLIEQLGQWRDETAGHYRADLSPVQWARPYLEQVPFVAAHCNYVSDDDLAILAMTNTSVAYCPVASDYFGHRDHRYRAMLDAGINVCFGSDSIVCFDPDQAQPLSTLTAMRHVYRRDRTDPATLLAMATTHGVRALGLDPKRYGSLRPDATARFAAVRFDPDDPTDPLEQVLLNDHPVETIIQARSSPSP